MGDSDTQHFLCLKREANSRVPVKVREQSRSYSHNHLTLCAAETIVDPLVLLLCSSSDGKSPFCNIAASLLRCHREFEVSAYLTITFEKTSLCNNIIVFLQSVSN